jgi:uncharacterized membrane-anchored protein YjiN (DUF445 family)
VEPDDRLGAGRSGSRRFDPSGPSRARSAVARRKAQCRRRNARLDQRADPGRSSRWIERYREYIRQYIIARVGDWNATEMTNELERNIGRDLQFIRINGTLEGGLVA